MSAEGGGSLRISERKRRMSEETVAKNGGHQKPKLSIAEEAILVSGPRSGYQLWKKSRASGPDQHGKVPNNLEGWRQLPMKEKLPFEERSKAEHEMYDIANFKGSKESWVLYITDIIQSGEEQYSPYNMMREGNHTMPPPDAPKDVHEAYWERMTENEQAVWTQKSLNRIKKRRKQFLAGKVSNWAEAAPMNCAAHLAVVQEALQKCKSAADTIDPVDAMLDTFMSTVPSLLTVLAEDGVVDDQSRMDKMMAQPLLLPGLTEFCGTLPFLRPDG